ncbi:MAG: crossover junction endodeoxyribonuclease RuvC [Gammaproteobacteria bacterium]|nr:crossover junction endodeoxyribonuclease RuvC [Gammaproteobacteria bacterium]NNF65957.1 crossover junction endodeoxyribonuclease RuvC [Gammaproteobacteria bacterium]
MGIDPGSRITGFGVIEVAGDQMTYLASGCIRTGAKPFNARLQEIYATIAGLISEHRPAEICLEKVFMHRNADSALKLGHARAAAICAVFANEATMSPLLAEYSAREIKQAVAGYGAAEKSQVQTMVCSLLSLRGQLQADAADALAVAVCHANTRQATALLERQLKAAQ